jgi:hypothetical protein
MSKTLGQIVEWAKPFIGDYFLLTDATLEPALTNANNLLGTILDPPFTWEWNRNYIDFLLQSVPVALTDYPMPLPDFGFIETATVQSVVVSDPPETYIAYSYGPIFQLGLRRSLEKSFQPGRPSFLSVFNDDQKGNITFRVLTAPDAQNTYQVEVTYQKAFVPLTNLSTPIIIPDKLIHIFQYGFLAMAYFYNQDSRFAEINQKFVATLLSAQQGLDEIERNVFLGNWYALLADQSMIGLKVNQGKQARGLI